jgi:hypothetical protein
MTSRIKDLMVQIGTYFMNKINYFSVKIITDILMVYGFIRLKIEKALMVIIKYIKNAILSFTHLLFTNNDISIDRLGPKICAVIKFVWLEKNDKLVQINRERSSI